MVVVFAAGIQHDLGLNEGGRPMLQESLSPQAAVEGFAYTVIDRPARSAAVQLHVTPVRPVTERGRRKLGPVVALHHSGQVALRFACGA